MHTASFGGWGIRRNRIGQLPGLVRRLGIRAQGWKVVMLRFADGSVCAGVAVDGKAAP